MNRKPLLTTLTFFVFAMGGAYLLFHVLDSSAELTWRGYALGGALAGFVVQFLLMKWAYSRLCDPPSRSHRRWSSSSSSRKPTSLES
ncbi:MAG: hypothetical protein AAF533_25185 [Acidobacteriota bacterium]